jgi:L-cysteine desulfidase
MHKQIFIDLLKRDVVPALGCTEPVCVALCAATATSHLESPVTEVKVAVNSGIYKNGMSAGIPNCTQVGLHHAAALGSVLKNPEKGLELLADITPEHLQQAESLIKNQAVEVHLDAAQKGLYVKATVRAGEDTCTCLIRDAHTNVVLVEKNGEILFEKAVTGSASGGDPAVEALTAMTIAQIRETVDSCTEEELNFLMDGVEMNEALAAYSESRESGVGIAKALRQEIGGKILANDLLSRVLLQVSSAAESRLDGCPLATMSSSGAGTKGLVVILPVSETAKAISASREATVKALALAHLINRYINAAIGKLSPMCSCVAASSTAASAAICYLLGGTDEQIGWAIRNMSGTVTGMICDGGKVGCALKVSTGSAAAVLCAITAVQNAALRASDGICAETPEACIRNMARIGVEGMANTDATILSVMQSK